VAAQTGADGLFLPEAKVQWVFAEAGGEIPLPEPMLSAIRSDIIETEEAFLSKANEDWHRSHPEDRPFLQATAIPGIRVSLGPKGGEPATKVVASNTANPTEPRRWWLPVAVFGGHGAIRLPASPCRSRARIRWR
jgi:hypothetical protein